MNTSKKGKISLSLTIAVVIAIVAGALVYFYSLQPPTTEEPKEIVTPEKEKIDFSQQGNLIRNNPGLKPDTWFLLYDQPGAPGVTMELIFDEQSVCKNQEAVKCTDFLSEQTVGERVMIEGVKKNNAVKVKTLKFI